MKLYKLKILILLISAFFNLENCFSIEQKNLVSEIILTDNDTTFRIIYLYDDNQNIVLETKAFIQNETWKNLHQTEFFFINNRNTKQLDRIWSENNWKDDHCIDFVNQNDELIESSSQYLHGVKTEYKKIVSKLRDTLLIKKTELRKNNQVWNTQYDCEYEYENNQLKNTIYKFLISNPFCTNFKNTNTYNEDGTLKSVLEEIENNDKTFIPVRLSTWYYEPATKLLSSQRSKIWKNTRSAWENEAMTTYDYNANKQLISEIFFYWKTMFWEKTANFEYKYNTQNELISKEQNEPIYNQWRNTIFINYNPLDINNSQFIESTLGFWGGKKGNLVSSYIPYNFNNELIIKKAEQIKVIKTIYNAVNSIDKRQNTVDKFISIYPNPSDGIFYYNASDYKVNSWSIFTANGVKVKQNDSGIYSGVIDLTDIPRGVYFFVANTAEKVLLQKIIKK